MSSLATTTPSRTRITGYDEVRGALADPRFFKDWARKLEPEGWAPDPVTGFLDMQSRFPSLSLAVPVSELRWRPSSLIHGLESLPVRLR